MSDLEEILQQAIEKAGVDGRATITLDVQVTNQAAERAAGMERVRLEHELAVVKEKTDALRRMHSNMLYQEFQHELLTFDQEPERKGLLSWFGGK